MLKLSAKPNRFLVNVFFGHKEGVVERFAIYKKDEEDSEGVPTLYIRNANMNHRDVSILTLLIMSFGLLSAITAWDTFCLKKSHVCTENPEISCFPVAANIYANNSDLNLTNAQEKPIDDCSLWNSEARANRVKFVCFQLEYDAMGAISDVGGLLSIFMLALKISSSGSLVVIDWAFNKKKYLEKTPADKKIVKRFYCLRIMTVILVAITEIGLCIVIIALSTILLKGTHEGNTLMVAFYSHGHQLLLVVGICSMFLLLPLEDYISKSLTLESMDSERVPDDKHQSYPECQRLLQSPVGQNMGSMSQTPGDFLLLA